MGSQIILTENRQQKRLNISSKMETTYIIQKIQERTL